MNTAAVICDMLKYMVGPLTPAVSQYQWPSHIMGIGDGTYTQSRSKGREVNQGGGSKGCWARERLIVYQSIGLLLSS